MSLSPRKRGLKFYIPLCFFSMRYDYTTESRFCVFTFYYVSILMGKLTESKNFKFDFTFHYVSIPINWPVRVFFQRTVIYIPLCFYFNLKSGRGLDFNLLYIPLYLYFNSSWNFSSNSCTTFTFHYVSILICVQHASFFRQFTFPFHYVSILIGPCACHRFSGRPLHSIMFLF